MSGPEEVRVGVQPLDRFQEILGRSEMRRALGIANEVRRRLSRRVLWNVNSTAVGGGVAEMLRSLLGYTRSVGIDSRWVVVEGNPEFFQITKRLHHALHGSPGDGTPLDEAAHAVYAETLRSNALALGSTVRARDIVLLHDPQTAGLAASLMRAGATVIWRCHIGHDRTNGEVEEGWRFLERYLADVPAFVFSRDAYVPEFCDHGRTTIIQPSIDAFSAKNQDLTEQSVRIILSHTGLVGGSHGYFADHTFLREDGSPSRVERRAEIVRLGSPPDWDTPLVVQVSRWDPLKDPVGVLRGFASLIDGPVHGGAELVLAGPDVRGVADDPEGAQSLEAVVEAWRGLPDAIRNRVHIASLPTDDVEENAAIVNALQRHAAVVVQKSLHEGFGLTVTEAMWKSRPVVASAVGGIQDQIEDGVSGLLLKDPQDLEEFAEALRSLLLDAERARRIGDAARERVRERFLGVGHLLRYADLIARLEDAQG